MAAWREICSLCVNVCQRENEELLARVFAVSVQTDVMANETKACDDDVDDDAHILQDHKQNHWTRNEPSD